MTEINQLLPTAIHQALINGYLPSLLNPFVTTSEVSSLINIPSGTLLGRFSASSGVAESITLGAGLSLSGAGVLTVAGGSVTSVSVVSANGFLGTVSNPTTTPAITISTTITGLLKGDGTAISAAIANTDYQSPISLTTTGTGAATFIANVLNIPTSTGTATTADNGLTATSGNIQLGGALIQNTLLDGAFDLLIGSVTKLNSFIVKAGVADTVTQTINNDGFLVDSINATSLATTTLSLYSGGVFGPSMLLEIANSGVTAYSRIKFDTVGLLSIESSNYVEINTPSVRMNSIGPNKLVGTISGPGGALTSVSMGTGLSYSGAILSISTAYVGQASITTLGTITTGVWNGTAIAAIYGGTGQSVYVIGDMLYADTTTTLAKRSIGATGQVLTVSGGVPVWATPSASTTQTYTSTAINYSALSTDNTIDTTASGITVTLPTAVGISGKIYTIKKSISSGTNTLATTGGQLIDGVATQSIVGLNWIKVQSNNVNWIIIG